MRDLTLYRARWVAPVINPRRASLRYRCLYPMQELLRRGKDVGIWRTGEPIDSSLALVFDAWTLFTTTNSKAAADAVVELAVAAQGKGALIVLDNCDNQFASVTQSPEWSYSLSLLQRLGRMADVLVSCSQALSDAMRLHVGGLAQHVVIDDPIEEKIAYPDDLLIKSFFSVRQKLAWLQAIKLRAALIKDQLNGRTPLVWFGSHGNHFSPGGMSDILPLRSVLERVAESHPISLTIISNQRKKFDAEFHQWSIPTHYLEWDRVTFLVALKMHEISIIPSVENAFTRCKSSNRLTLSIHHGLSVIADPVPSYKTYSDVARIGEWEVNLHSLLSDAKRRRSDRADFQNIVRGRNSVSVVADHWDSVILHRDSGA
jgi:hypothetical protein